MGEPTQETTEEEEWSALADLMLPAPQEEPTSHVDTFFDGRLWVSGKSPPLHMTTARESCEQMTKTLQDIAEEC